MPFHAGRFLKLPRSYWLGLGSLLLLLVLSSGPVYAEWVLVRGADEAGRTVYVDRDTIRRKGNVVKRWELIDFKTIRTEEGSSYLSVKVQREYDCVEERYQVLAVTEFSGNMGRGNMVFSLAKEDQWSPVEPQSIGQALWEGACTKK